jgi:hypothetical protein
MKKETPSSDDIQNTLDNLEKEAEKNLEDAKRNLHWAQMDLQYLLDWINPDPDDDEPLIAITEYHRLERVLYIRTLEGVMMAEPGDWIIKGIHGEFCPCKPSIFEESYSKINSEGFVEKGWRSNGN